MSQRGGQHAGWGHLDCILGVGGREIHQRMAKSLCHQTALLNFNQTLMEWSGVKAAAPEAVWGATQSQPPSLLAAQTVVKGQPHGPQVPTSTATTPCLTLQVGTASTNP